LNLRDLAFTPRTVRFIGDICSRLDVSNADDNPGNQTLLIVIKSSVATAIGGGTNQLQLQCGNMFASEL
jgi:hypothetical protein